MSCQVKHHVHIKWPSLLAVFRLTLPTQSFIEIRHFKFDQNWEQPWNRVKHVDVKYIITVPFLLLKGTC